MKRRKCIRYCVPSLKASETKQEIYNGTLGKVFRTRWINIYCSVYNLVRVDVWRMVTIVAEERT